MRIELAVLQWRINMNLTTDFIELSMNNKDYVLLKNKTILMTGATGMLGRYLTEYFIFLNKEKNLNLRLILLIRNRKKAEHLFGNILNKNIQFLVSDLISPIDLNENINFIIHAASLADPQYYKTNPVDVASPNILGTFHLLELAKKKKIDHFLYFSSAEVYGKILNSQLITESTLGIIDPLNIRSCYSESKRMGETLCKAYAEQYCVPTSCLRIFHTYGPTLNYHHDQRVFSEFVKSVIEKNQIIMKSSGEAKSAFCYISDMVSACLVVLTHGLPGEAYNMANDECFISIKELAQEIIKAFPERNIKLHMETRESTSNYVENKTTTYLNVSTAKLRALGWKPTISVQEGFRRTITFIEKNSATE